MNLKDEIAWCIDNLEEGTDTVSDKALEQRFDGLNYEQKRELIGLYKRANAMGYFTLVQPGDNGIRAAVVSEKGRNLVG